MNATTIEERQVMDLAPTERSSQPLARQPISGEIAARFGVSQQTISGIKAGKRWGHVE